MSIRYRGGLPLLKWLHKNHPELTVAIARQVRDQRPVAAIQDSGEADREIRPTEGELLQAASDAFRVYVRKPIRQAGVSIRHVGKGYRLVPSTTGYRGDEWQHLGDLAFYRGALREWGVTKKGKKLRPRDDIRGNGKNKRNPGRYLKTKPTTPAPMDAEGIERTPCMPPPDDGKPSLYYDPLPGVEEARAELDVAMASYSGAITKCPTKVATNAHFFGGIIRPKAGAKTGTIGAWEAPEVPKGEVAEVIEEVAAGGNLKSLGVRMGYGPQYADRAAKALLIETAKMLTASNDNNKEKKVAA